MGKIKNFRVNLPYEYARDKKWIDENIKPGDVDEYRVFKGIMELQGSIELSQELHEVLHQLEKNQHRIETKLDYLFSILNTLKGGEDILIEEKSPDTFNDRVEKRNLKEKEKNLEVRRQKFYQVLEEALERGIQLRTSHFKEMGGKYATAVSYSYTLFKGWKDALYHFYKNREEKKDNSIEKKEK